MARSIIKLVSPVLEGGKYPVKTEIDRYFTVSARLRGKGEAKLLYRKRGASTWKRVKMEECCTGFIHGHFKPEEIGYYEYAVEVKPPRGKTEMSDIYTLMVEPVYARYAAWYEMFHRSQGTEPGKSATFDDCIKRLDEIAWMGFDVIYFPPIHPIGYTNRKGPNNSLTAPPGAPGSPWAIGSHEGGHTSVHPDLGGMEAFKRFVKAAKERGMEIALDISYMTSPDHPWVKEHPNWYHYRPDGTIACAENPPKKYEDVYPLNFYPVDKDGKSEKDLMWAELRDILFFWRKLGVTHFRMDNPHTKPTEFWAWLIEAVKKEYPDCVFLSEAFTNYEKLEELARVGFSQSYTYFTWRNTKNEMIEYIHKLTNTDLVHFLRANFFTNTPDIAPTFLQTSGRPGFKLRFVLASTLSSVYGIYNGFELCESDAFPGTEIYRNSEKYEYKVWDWNRPGNIKDYIARVNSIRKSNPALHYYKNLQIVPSTNEHVIAYSKSSPEHENHLVMVVTFDPYTTQETRVSVPIDSFGIPSGAYYRVTELITGQSYIWYDRDNFIRLDPSIEPAYIFRIEEIVEKKDLTRKELEGSPDVSVLATEHAKRFFELRHLSVVANDVYARHELGKLFREQIAPRVYTGPGFDRVYTDCIDRLARQQGHDSIIKAYITTPGH